MQEELITKSFESNPITLNDNKLTVHLDKLNEELAKYNLRINSFDDFSIDRELSSLNAGDVLKVFVTKVEPDGDWNTNVEKWFFNDVKEMEDKFEALSEIISSAQLDRGDLILTLYLNKKDVALDKQFEAGGTVDPDPKDEAIRAKVEEQIKNSPAEVFQMIGIEQSELPEQLEAAKQKAFEHYKGQELKPVWVFLHGRKMDLAMGATLDTLYLQTLLQSKCHDYANQNLNGLDNPRFAENYAKNKGILGVDMVRGMAIAAKVPVFHVSDEVVADVIYKLCE